ncbi:hypothetical protein JTE90_020162 [Oedothorax gibbosus]|uniref:DNA 3'-5' helicase n=1 Tax=Oedothorax gibbosus TaxID=931172 RepID=A0AAV6TXD8_9ARAC|nr:hypothetical protein JTE90_020162 [Oedothorax gibbosus]
MDAFQTLFGDVKTHGKNEEVKSYIGNNMKYQFQKQLYMNNSSSKVTLNNNLTSGSGSAVHLIPVTEIPAKYQSVFSEFPYFNVVQSTVFQDAFYTDKPLVVSAPTGSGKTVIFELAIVRLLMLISDLGQMSSRYKVVYMAPVKSLCNERYEDWQKKFVPFGALCVQLTGDTEVEDYFNLQKYTIILTTPEKWDSVTRLWKNNKNLVHMVKLLLIDEIHLLNEEERGATMEAALSRMKTIQSVLMMGQSRGKPNSEPSLRFVAASATFPNVEDAAEWLSTSECKGISYKLNENLRPVQLRKVVLGYPNSKASEFCFDLNLSYKLGHVIQSYSEGKPTLVFCATRKSVVQTACILSKTFTFVQHAAHKQQLIDSGNIVHESKLRECILNGIGFHHAGLDLADRRLVEELFLQNRIQVLISTSTLAMGVNFPAHLVVIKSTVQYAGGSYKEYTETQVLQMIGRAGRPQFDTSATAVIMTKASLKDKYDSIVSGKQVVESSLLKHIVEHLNAEIVLGTITDVSIAMEWIKATFLYQRVFKNPKHYGINMELSKEKIERKLQDMCIIELNGLRKYKLIYMDDDSFNLQPTDTGRLMAKYYLSFETMKSFSTLTGAEHLSDLLALVSASKEFDDIQLRVNEKRFLNDLNKSKMTSIRFPLQGKIKTKAMKINCLTQATFGCMAISEATFNQDICKIFRSGVRVTQCLAEYLNHDMKGFSVLYNAVILAKCFKARLWENSKYVSRQLEKIGVTLSTLLVNAGINTFEKIRNTNPRDIELILNRNPPFGNVIAESVKHLPKYDFEADQTFAVTADSVTVSVAVFITNIQDLQRKRTTHDKHGCYLIIGDAYNNVIVNKKIMDQTLIEQGRWMKKFDVPKAQKDELHIHLISESYVGLDIHKSFTIQYTSPLFNNNSFGKKTDFQNPENNAPGITAEGKRTCNHRCLDKSSCGHPCCKTGVNLEKKSKVDSFFDQLHNKMNSFPSKRVKIDTSKTNGGIYSNKDGPSFVEDVPKTNEQKDSTFGEQDTLNNEWNEYIEEGFTPDFDEDWAEDVWDEVTDNKATKPIEKETELPTTISFDVDFENTKEEQNVEAQNLKALGKTVS